MGARATSGHYFTYIYNFKNKKWNRISDEQVTEVTEEEVLKISKGIKYFMRIPLSLTNPGMNRRK